MFLTIHAATGIIIGQHVKNVWLAFILGFVSHFILDAIPHGDEGLIRDKDNITKKETLKMFILATIDGLAMFLLLVVLYLLNIIELTDAIFAAIIGSILPDFLNAMALLTKQPWLKKLSDWHFDLHNFTKKTVSFKTGLVIQLAITAGLVLFLFINK